jgi:hypothetical protein
VLHDRGEFQSTTHTHTHTHTSELEKNEQERRNVNSEISCYHAARKIASRKGKVEKAMHIYLSFPSSLYKLAIN